MKKPRRARSQDLEQLDHEAQVHVRDRLTEALDGRSWNWLAEKTGVPQSTLSAQLTGLRFSIETVVRAARVLRKPLAWFFPGNMVVDDERAIAAYREIEALVLAARERGA